MCSLYVQNRECAEGLLQRSLPYIEECLHYRFQSIVDFGCGFGLQACEFAKAGKDVTGCDISFVPEAEQLARDTGYKLVDGSWRNLPKKAFDAGFSHHCLEHARDPIGWLHQWGLSLRPGGLIFVVVPSYSPYLSAGHIAMGLDSAKLAYLMALAGFDCSRGWFDRRDHEVFGVAERPDEMVLADTTESGWCVDGRMPLELTSKSTINPPGCLRGDGHDDLRTTPGGIRIDA